METSAIDAGNPFAAGKNNKTGKPANEAFSDLLSTLFSKLGQTAEDDAALDEPFFQAKPRPVERPIAERTAPERSDEIAHAEERRVERDEAPETIGYVEAAPEQRAPQASTATDEQAATESTATDPTGGAKPAADATAKPVTAPTDQSAAKPAPLAAPATAQPTPAGNAAQPSAATAPQIQVTVNEAPVQAQPAQKVAADAALATQVQAQAPAEDADTLETEPRSATPNANGLVAGKGEQNAAAGAGNQAGAQGNNQGNGQGQNGQAQPGFANIAAQMLQAAPLATAAASGAAAGFAATLDTPDEAGATTLPLGAAGATPAAAAAQRRAETAAAPQLPRLPATEQIAINIQKAIKAGKDQVTIKLQPEELGRIDVKLEVGEDGRVTAQVRVEKPETLELLQRDARGLERALQEAGLRADSGSLSFGLRGENRQDGQNGQQAKTTHSPLALNAEQDDITPIIAARSAEGRIDLHV
jgi:flagellar hook-length control protein FliK